MCDHPHMGRQNGFPQTWREARRKRAFERKQLRWKQGAIAEALGVSPAAVSQWLAHIRGYGLEAWQAKPRATGPMKLTANQWGLIPELLSHGAEAYGFRGECWTCARVATVIGEEFGVWYHKAHVSRLLKRLHWTPQLPSERAAQRHEALIEQWRLQTWAKRKKRRTVKAGPSCVWTSPGFISCQGTSARTRPAARHRSCGGHIPAIMCR
jgi:transposase